MAIKDMLTIPGNFALGGVSALIGAAGQAASFLGNMAATGSTTMQGIFPWFSDKSEAIRNWGMGRMSEASSRIPSLFSNKDVTKNLEEINTKLGDIQENGVPLKGSLEKDVAELNENFSDELERQRQAQDYEERNDTLAAPAQQEKKNDENKSSLASGLLSSIGGLKGAITGLPGKLVGMLVPALGAAFAGLANDGILGNVATRGIAGAAKLVASSVTGLAKIAGRLIVSNPAVAASAGLVAGGIALSKHQQELYRKEEEGKVLQDDGTYQYPDQDGMFGKVNIHEAYSYDESGKRMDETLTEEQKSKRFAEAAQKAEESGNKEQAEHYRALERQSLSRQENEAKEQQMLDEEVEFSENTKSWWERSIGETVPASRMNKAQILALEPDERAKYDEWRQKTFTPEENALFEARLNGNTLSDDMQKAEANLVVPGTKFGEAYAAAFSEGFQYNRAGRYQNKYSPHEMNQLPSTTGSYLSKNNKYLDAATSMADKANTSTRVEQSTLARGIGDVVSQQIVNTTNVTNINNGASSPNPTIIQVGSAINRVASGQTGIR